MIKYQDIRLLEKDVAARIAAGEVVERPLSVVKELVENSIDASADSVTVEIKKGGREYIRVTDNGCGIADGQLEIAFKRHATSKIRTDEDLDSIESLGFRGEALASIAAVSKCELITKTSDEKLGSFIRINGGETEEIGNTAAENGTSVIIRDLFYNTPARKKFLKADNAESSLIIDYVSKIAIAYPDIKFRIISNDNVLFATQGKGDLKKTILTVYGSAADVNLLPVDYSAEGIRLFGFISAPKDSRTNRKYQVFYVNGRLVKNKTLEKALDDAYSDKLFDGRYPSCYLFLELSPQSLDVNIHPHKTEIRFYDDDAVKDFSVRAIRRALLDPESNTIKSTEVKTESEKFSYAPVIPKVMPEKTSASADDEGGVDRIILSSTKPAENYFDQLRMSEPLVNEQVEANFYKPSEKLVFSSLEPIGQVFATYIVLRDTEYVYYIDQHAAHERIMYEKLLKSFNSEENASQILLMPFMVQLNAKERAAAEDKISLLLSLGFSIEDFGPEDLIVKAVPGCMSQKEAEDFVYDVIDNDARDVRLKLKDIISAACKSAVKANDILSEEEINELLILLDQCENPYSCPHGRPTYIRFSEYELEKMFKRK